MNEAQTRFNKIDPKLRDAGWGIVPGSNILVEYTAEPSLSCTAQQSLHARSYHEVGSIGCPQRSDTPSRCTMWGLRFRASDIECDMNDMKCDMAGGKNCRSLFLCLILHRQQNGNGKLTALIETLSRKAASPQQSPSQLGFVFGSRALWLIDTK